MRKDRYLAESLRRKGHSYNTIVRELGVPKSTLSDWFGGRTWSEKIRKRLFRGNCIPSSRAVRAMVTAQKA